MMTPDNLTFLVAGKYFRIHFADGFDGRPLLPSYAPFCVREAKEELMFSMEVGPELVSVDPEGEVIGHFDVGGNNHSVYLLEDGGYKMVIDTLEQNAACAFRTSADFARCEASLFGTDSDRSFGLNNAIMIAFAFSGARHDLLLFHSSVVMNEGRAYLFLGKSGTGKSTHSDLWVKYIPGSEILNDDNPAVFLREGKVFVSGTPWSGKRNYYRQLIVPVGAFVRLEQAPDNEIRREGKLQAFASLLSSTSSMIWDKPSYNAICDTLSAVAMQVPVFHLKNRPEAAAARMSRQATREADADTKSDR